MSLIPRHSVFDIDHFFDNSWFPFSHNLAKPSGFAPRVDIKELDSSFEISAELPGIDKKDIHVTLQDGVLSIEAETIQNHDEEKDGKVIRQERRYGKFVRSFDIGKQVQESDITASFENGVLTLTAPKVNTEVPQSRRIEIL